MNIIAPPIETNRERFLMGLCQFRYNDGGRAAAGYKGDAGDCVTRSIAIVTGLPYQKVYDDLSELTRLHRLSRWSRHMATAGRGLTARDGVEKKVWQPYVLDLGFAWTPTMKIGSGCKVHLRADELPSGALLVQVSGHLTAVIDGVIHDKYDCSRDGTRCVYGYYREVAS